ncbi:MAG: MFS transporter, partial [Porphyromonadaceae bacterium CG2_30_38_12]
MKTILIKEQSEIENIINACDYCVLTLNGADGFPYAIPMNFSYHNNRILLHSAPFGSHIENIQRDNRVTVMFCTKGEIVYQHIHVACSYRMRAQSVVCQGRVHFIENETEKMDLMNSFMHKYTNNSFKYSKPAI